MENADSRLSRTAKTLFPDTPGHNSRADVRDMRPDFPESRSDCRKVVANLEIPSAEEQHHGQIGTPSRHFKNTITRKRTLRHGFRNS